MSSWMIDIGALLIIAIFAFIGYKRGLFLTLFSVLSSVIGFVAAILLYPFLTPLIKQTPVFNTVKDNIINHLVSSNTLGSQMTVTEALDNLQCPQIIKDTISSQLQNTSVNVTETIGSIIAEYVMNAIVIVIVFIIVFVLLSLIKHLFAGIFKLPILKQLNEFGGLAFGIVEGIIVLILAGVVMYFLAGNIDGGFINAVKESIYGSVFFENNILIKFIGSRQIKF